MSRFNSFGSFGAYNGGPGVTEEVYRAERSVVMYTDPDTGIKHAVAERALSRPEVLADLDRILKYERAGISTGINKYVVDDQGVARSAAVTQQGPTPQQQAQDVQVEAQGIQQGAGGAAETGTPVSPTGTPVSPDERGGIAPAGLGVGLGVVAFGLTALGVYLYMNRKKR